MERLNGVSDTVVQFFNNAKNAGLKVHLGMVPCWPMSPQDVAADLQKIYTKHSRKSMDFSF
jgi:hypothetical protein